jgi:hypothetical protein
MSFPQNCKSFRHLIFDRIGGGRDLFEQPVTKRLVVLVGQKKAVAIAVRNVSGRWRWSKLAEWLSADVSKRYVSTRRRA